MEFTVTTQPLFAVESDCVFVPVFEENKKLHETQIVTSLDKKLLGAVTKTAEAEGFTGLKGSILSIQTHGSFPTRNIIFIGMGSIEKITVEDILLFGAKTARTALSYKAATVTVSMPEESIPVDISKRLVTDVVTGFRLGSYSFDKYKKAKSDKKQIDHVLLSIPYAHVHTEEDIQTGKLIADAVQFARDLVNEPPSLTTPTYLADTAKQIVQKNNALSLTVLSQSDMEKMGMGALLSIARGSDEEPRFIHLTYKGGTKKTITLVGKGITFDTGGLSLKPAQGMETMKLDMSGAAVVLAVFSILTALHPEITVHGLISATENMPGPHAIKPGDVVTAMNGKTIEILNTDAEGRVVLADAMSYAGERIKSDAIIDFATLTGACMIALGEDIAGLFCNDANLTDQLKNSAQHAGEKIWQLPLEEEYKNLLKSHVADIKNIGGKYGGAITGALFIGAFVPEYTPWAHLDIAGPSFAEKDSLLCPHGGTGFGIRTIIEYLMNV